MIKKIDLIIPSVLKSPKLHRFERYPFPSLTGNWFPVWFFKNILKKNGINVRFLNTFNLDINKLSNIVGVDHKVVYDLANKYNLKGNLHRKNKFFLSFLKKLKKKVDLLCLFDNKDSTDIQQEFLPTVDYYFKKQCYKDLPDYSKKFYLKRIFTDFYARNYEIDISDENLYSFDDVLKFKQKIKLSWNFAYKDYRHSNSLNRLVLGFNRGISPKFFAPNNNRELLLSANFSVKSVNELLYFQRKMLLEILEQNFKSKKQISLGKVPKSQYLKNMRISKTVVSPFGWGEICYRDFETFIAGAALIKPNINHIITWPDLFIENETYIPISWKIENWEKEFCKILSDDETLLKVAQKGQNVYKNIWSKEGQDSFVDHFKEMFGLI